MTDAPDLEGLEVIMKERIAQVGDRPYGDTYRAAWHEAFLAFRDELGRQALARRAVGEGGELEREAIEKIVEGVILSAVQLGMVEAETVQERVSNGLKAAALRDPAVTEILAAIRSPE